MESDLTRKEDIRVPWPGPQPYDEEDWNDFFGRDVDLKRLLDRVPDEKITILLGASGTGKTSLIRAGLVPFLRKARYHPRNGRDTIWPVLLLRRWGALGVGSLDDTMVKQLESAFEAIREWGINLGHEKAEMEAKNLADDLREIREGGTCGILEVIENLARAQANRSSSKGGGESGLILIFDQFEEQLRAGTKPAADALNLIGNLFRSKAPTRVLVSMRQEYLYALRPLEQVVGPLSGGSVVLEALKEEDVREVIRQSSNNSHLPIDDDVSATIVNWLSARAVASSNDSNSSDEEMGRYPGGQKQLEKGLPDLLQLQAVLLELCSFALDNSKPTVDRNVFIEFVANFVHDGSRRDLAVDWLNMVEPRADALEREFADLVLGGALERWIELALSNKTRRMRKARSSTGSTSHAQWADMDENDLRLQVHRTAVRLASKLSSGDYKVSQEENSLFRQTLGDEIGRLGIKDPEQRSKIKIIDATGGAPPRINWEDLVGDKKDEGSIDQKHQMVLSGLARLKEWSPETAGNKILVCFKETLHRLATANILQYTVFGGERGVYWELVHDQFGPSFTKWAERQRGTWDDCKSSLVICSGFQPIAVPVLEIKSAIEGEPYILKMISWQGCGVEHSRGERLTLTNVRFEECHLVGTIFDNITFRGCSFENCDLTGVLFRRCEFRSENKRPTTFVRCDSNVAIVDSAIEVLEFQDCHLQQPAIKDTFIEGEVRYTMGTRVIQGFFDVKEGALGKDPRIWFSAESRACFCTAYRRSYGYIDFETEDPGMHNSQMIKDFRTRGGEQ